MRQFQKREGDKWFPFFNYKCCKVNIETISRLVDQYLSDNELSDMFLVEVRTHNSKIEVFLDSDEQVTFAKCRKLSRHLEEIFDEEKWYGEKYTLEVSSAGVGRPLRMPRQFMKNLGRDIEIIKTDEAKLKGTLQAADEEKIHITWQEKVKEGKKKVKVDKEEFIDYKDIDKAKIKVSFNKK